MENEISLKRVTRGAKRYVYLRATGECLVRGFTGSDRALEQLLETKLGMPLPVKRRRSPFLVDGWRSDAADRIHKTTRARACHRDRAYSLTPESILGMLRASKDRCEVTGMPFDYHPLANQNWRTNPFGPSLDRIDNKGGYEPGNVRLVCACVNYAINEFGLEIFDKMCRAYMVRTQQELRRLGVVVG